MTEAKTFRTFIRIFSLLKSERLSTNIKVTLHKAPIRSVMTYACPVCELVADTYLLKNKVLQAIENFPRYTPVCDLHTASNLPYVYNYIRKLYGQQPEVI
jgi:hypothetical protein